MSDSDIGETFKALRDYSKKKRDHNKHYSTTLLKFRRIKFEIKNNGYHLIVQGPKGLIDFWPSTGLWRVRGEKDVKSRRGVQKLIEYMSKKDA